MPVYGCAEMKTRTDRN